MVGGVNRFIDGGFWILSLRTKEYDWTNISNFGIIKDRQFRVTTLLKYTCKNILSNNKNINNQLKDRRIWLVS